MAGLNPFLEVDIKLMASEAESERLKGQLRRMTAERDKIAERLKAARLRSKQDRDAIVALIEEEARMLKSADPHLIVAGCDASVSHVIGLELEHLARKVARDLRHGAQAPTKQIDGGDLSAYHRAQLE